ncbi:3-methyl-2-oxobutanoate hydroxymethyltransferase [Planctomycetota bacterium]
MEKKLTIADLFTAKDEDRKLVAVSCYDYTTAALAAQAEVDIILVGDSAAQIMLGFDSTLPVSMDTMVTLTSAARRGAPNQFLVADMPFLSYQASLAEAMKNAGRFVTESGAQMVKIEISHAYLDVIKMVSNAGIAVMAHIGIRPQFIGQMGRFKAEGTTAEMAYELLLFADQLIEAGARALLIEGTAAEVAERITQRVKVPVIGCGSGPGCDGQVLIAADILGLTQGCKPKFSRSFVELGEQCVAGFADYASNVRDRQYPGKQHSYHMKKGELGRLSSLLGE